MGYFQGNITTAVRLDREQAGAESYTLTVLAADDAIRSRQGTTQVNMTPLIFVRSYFDRLASNTNKLTRTRSTGSRMPPTNVEPILIEGLFDTVLNEYSC